MNILRYYQPLGGFVDNIGDNIVEWGARTVLPDRDDTIYLVGTPWFWDLCEQSKKYEWLEAQINHKRARNKRLMAVGIGACLPLESGVELLRKPETVKVCRRIWSRFQLIIVRDPLAKKFLESLDIPCHLLPCPSVFCPVPGLNIPRRRSTIFIDAPPFHDDMRRQRQQIVPPVMADRFLYQPGVFRARDVVNLFELWTSYGTLVSCRLHALLPLATLRLVAICPLDSRAQTATWLGVPVWPEEPQNMDWDLEGWMENYMKVLR